MIKKLLLLSTAAILFSACSKKAIDVAPTDPVVEAPKPYSISEDFENSSKTAYAAADVSMPTGTWNLDNALIGTLDADLKNGKKSIRMKTGKITMKGDISGLKMLYISHGKYGTDPVSTWKLFISSDGGTTFTQLGNDMVENNTKLVVDSFKVTLTGKVRFEIRNTGSTDAARINLDDITFKGTGDPGIVAGGSDTDPTEPSTPGNAAATRGVTAGADAQPSTGDDSNSLFGNPSNASATTPDNFLLDQKYYTESYSSTRSTPNWVSWHIDATSITGVAKRQDSFAGFNGLSADMYVVQSNSYSGSGFDRGHNCPSADRTSSVDANNATFLMTNMIPQAPQNNQQTWGNLENYLRTQVVSGNEVYIIMGSYGTGGSGSNGSASTINNGKVTVPSNVWKVAVIIPAGNGDLNRVSSNTRVIAVNTPNINTIDSDWKKYIVTVRDIEKATGYNLLSNLPQNIQDAIETKKDSGN
nr:DNA/RNA non-specific endonuclease [Pedobacter sp. ASV19]